MSIVLPALSEDGWVTTDGRQAEYLFSHFFLSDYSQTYIYTDQVTSFSWILATANGNVTEIQSLTQSRLERYFSRYFNNVVVEVNTEENPDNPTEVTLVIYLTFVGKDGVQYNLSRMVFANNSLIKKVVDLSNNGTVLFNQA